MAQAILKQIYKKLWEIDSKVSALLVKEEKATPEEKTLIRRGEKQFREGKFKSWREIKASMK